MSIKALQDYTYVSKYARYNKEEKRRETWSEAVERVKQMHLRKFPQIAEEINWAFDKSEKKKVLGSQRALQFGGRPVEEKNARMYNCTVSFCDRIRFFQECLWLLLCGCGTGFSVQKHHIAKLPCFSHKGNLKRKFAIPDTIEGWADSLGVLMATYFPHPELTEWAGCEVEFDYSAIRPAGSFLSSGVGKAPGPEPLRRALEIIRKLLNDRLNSGQKRLKPIDAYDIIMHASDAVLSGGVRRSATICIFSFDDEEMVKAKTGNWFIENPQRGRSNNSALLLKGSVTEEEFNNLMTSVKEFGEPGFYWSDSTEQLPNPCVEIGMWPVCVITKESGWQFCNLCEINGKQIKTKADFAEASKAAAIIGTIQAAYTDFAYLGRVTKRIVEKEALLGVSITGMMDNPDIIFDPKIQREMANLIVKTNEEIADKIGINPAARSTCVKPAGTTSCILGSASGIHPHHAKRYFRRVQANALEAPFQLFKMANPSATEKSVWSANGTDEIATFCVEVPDGAKTKNDIPALELLKYVKLTQENWVQSGRVESRCTAPWLTHNVSNTINVKPDEWEQVADYIYANRQWFAGISLLPSSGDLDYPQAPFCNVSTAKEIIAKYGDGALMASGLIVDGIHAYSDNLWAGCDDVIRLQREGKIWLVPPTRATKDDEAITKIMCGQVPNLTPSESIRAKNDWIRRVRQFAQRYCEGDVRKCTYLMKEVNNWKLWLDLKREYQDVDYMLLREDTDQTKPMETLACSGGACQI
jgi:ribonucleoside-triphosphate reductase